MRHFLLALAAATCLTGVAAARTVPAGTAPATVPAGPQIGRFGFDEAGMDRGVKPGDDFYAFANGTWAKTTEIPADRSSYGMFHRLQDLSRERTRAILEEARARPGTKIGDFYASFMDEAAVNAKGIAPASAWIAAIKGAKDKAALAAEMGRLLRVGVGSPFDMGINQDDKAPENYIPTFAQGGLGLPDRDYFLKADAPLAKARGDYQAYLVTLFTLAGEPDAAARAQAVFAFENGLAQVQWSQVESRDADKVYNKWSRADFDAKAPGFDWGAYLTAAGVNGQAAFLVAQPSAFAGSARLVAQTPLAVLKDYVLVRTLDGYANYLSQPFVDARFAFRGTKLTGAPQLQDRWKRGVDLVSAQIGEEVGQVYVARYFPPEAKAEADKLVRNVIAAMGDRLRGLEWMAPETKQKALAKLAAFTPKIGYPDRWRDYSALAVRRDDLFGNVARAEAFEWQRNLNKLGKPLDRGEWHMVPMTINAYANFGMNEIVFPAAILQPPFFDPKADPAVNYGAIGVVIGHEISHHFDDQGRKYDASGRLTDWWTPQDVARFDALTKKLVAQYDAYEPLPGEHVQGALTLGENIGDLAGLAVAIDAYHKSLGGRPAPVIDGFTGDQRFYLGYAQVWRTKYRPEVLRQQLLSDPHSPGPERVATVRNVDAWYAAFDPLPGGKLYLAPKDRVRIW